MSNVGNKGNTEYMGRMGNIGNVGTIPETASPIPPSTRWRGAPVGIFRQSFGGVAARDTAVATATAALKARTMRFAMTL